MNDIDSNIISIKKERDAAIQAELLKDKFNNLEKSVKTFVKSIDDPTINGVPMSHFISVGVDNYMQSPEFKVVLKDMIREEIVNIVNESADHARAFCSLRLNQ